MDIANEILDAIEIIVDKKIKDNVAQIYQGVCKSVSGNNCVLTINGKDNTVQWYGSTPKIGGAYRVFVPNGNMSTAFIIVSSAVGISPLIENGTSVVPTGTYSETGYYDTDYGVKVGYVEGGDVLISMKAKSSTAYENLWFAADSLPDGVTLTSDSSSYDTANPAGQIFACMVSGLTRKATLAIDMSTRNSTYDYVECAITITYVD